MPLQSELFKEDAALAACLVKDSAHVTKGARGQHVEKIQTALFILDAARIVGSSRVDLQACKLEYSIVSPK